MIIGTSEAIEIRHGMTAQLGPAANELVFRRVVNAPREAVFRAWTEPQELAQWWGPSGYKCTCKQDDGRYRIVMLSPNDVEYALSCLVVERQEPERLVLSLDTRDHPREWLEQLDACRKTPTGRALLLRVTVTFDEHDGKTKVTIVNLFESEDEREAASRLGHLEGWAQSLVRLEQHLARA